MLIGGVPLLIAAVLFEKPQNVIWSLEFVLILVLVFATVAVCERIGPQLSVILKEPQRLKDLL